MSSKGDMRPQVQKTPEPEQVERLEDGGFIVHLRHPLENPKAVDPEKLRLSGTVYARHVRACSMAKSELDQGFLLACALCNQKEELIGRLHHKDFDVLMGVVMEISGK